MGNRTDSDLPAQTRVCLVSVGLTVMGVEPLVLELWERAGRRRSARNAVWTGANFPSIESREEVMAL